MFTNALKEELSRVLGLNCYVSSLMDYNKVRALCVEFGLYDAGTNSEYHALLKACREPGYSAVYTAKNIWDHTSESRKKELEELDFTLSILVWKLVNDCTKIVIYDEEK